MLVWALFGLNPALAQGEARLFLENPPQANPQIGGNVLINVRLADVSDLFGAELILQYDPTQLRVRDAQPQEGVQISPGPLLDSFGGFIARNNVDPEAGLIRFSFTLLPPNPGVSGEGILASIAFEPLTSGPFTIEIAEARLASSDSQLMPVRTQGIIIDAIPAVSTTPGLTSILSFGVALLAALLLLLVLLPRLRPEPLSDAGEVGTVRRVAIEDPLPHQSAAALVRQGRQAYERGNQEMAYRLFNEAIQFEPSNAQAWLGKGLSAQDSAERRICFQRALTLDPQNVEAQTALQDL